MIANATASHRQQLIAQMQQPTPAPTSPPAAVPNDYWFMRQATPVAGQAVFDTNAVVAPGTTATDEPATAPQAATPTAEEEAMVAQLRAANADQSIADDHLKHIKTPEELLEDAQNAAAIRAAEAAAAAAKAQVTSDKQAAIMNLASNDDQNIATLARRARKEAQMDDGEVVISLHR